MIKTGSPSATTSLPKASAAVTPAVWSALGILIRVLVPVGAMRLGCVDVIPAHAAMCDAVLMILGAGPPLQVSRIAAPAVATLVPCLIAMLGRSVHPFADDTMSVETATSTKTSEVSIPLFRLAPDPRPATTWACRHVDL